MSWSWFDSTPVVDAFPRHATPRHVAVRITVIRGCADSACSVAKSGAKKPALLPVELGAGSGSGARWTPNISQTRNERSEAIRSARNRVDPFRIVAGLHHLASLDDHPHIFRRADV